MIQYFSKTGDMVDAICYRNYGTNQGTAEIVYEANRCLADFGAILPSGVVINLPDIPTTENVKTIKLWD